MFPRLFEIPLGAFSIPINAYGVMVLAGFLAGLWVMGSRARDRGLSPELMSDLAVWILLGGLVGARIVYVVFYNRGEFDFRLFDLSDGGLHPAGALAGLGAGAGVWWWRGRRTTQGQDAPGRVSEGPPQTPSPAAPPARRAACIALILLGSLVAARALHLALNASTYNFKIFAIWEGGIVFYGGFFGALASCLFFLRRRSAPILPCLDIVAPSVALGMVFGRIGCFLKGCCYGGVSSVPWAVAFPRIVETVTRDGRPGEEISGSPAFLDHLDGRRLLPGATASLPVHPTQLYEAAAMAVLFFALSWYWRRRPRPGRVLAALGVGYGVWRFGVEFLRGDAHPMLGGLHFSQLVSLGVMGASAVVWGVLRPGSSAGPARPEREKTA